MTDIDKLRKLAAAADAIDASAPDVDCTVYYDYPGCAKDQECRVATAHCRDWAAWIAATTPAKVIAIIDALAAAEKDRDHWKANHDNAILLRRLFTARNDLPPDRVVLAEQINRLEAERDEAQAQVAAVTNAYDLDASPGYKIALLDALKSLRTWQESHAKAKAERDALIAAAKGMAKELRDEQRRADELAEKLAVERRVWCDKPEDRLYHAADRTWWMRHPKTLRPVGADPPPLEVTEAQFAAALHAFCMVYWGHHDLDTKATGVDAALAAAFTAAGGA